MSYEQLALLYDKLMAHAPYDEWVRFSNEIFQKHAGRVKRIADLGCGTGEITVRLAAQGYTMTGIDLSEEMLAVAQHKATQKNKHAQWLQQDLRELGGMEMYDAAVSYCDVMNYITEPQEVFQVIENVYNILKPGGLFVFDIHDLDFINHNYLHHTFADVQDDFSYIWFCTPGEEPGEMFHDLTFFLSEGELYRRFEEQHHQRTHPVNFYKKILERCGFENINIYSDFSSKIKNTEHDASRIFISAVKGP